MIQVLHYTPVGATVDVYNVIVVTGQVGPTLTPASVIAVNGNYCEYNPMLQNDQVCMSQFCVSTVMIG